MHSTQFAIRDVGLYRPVLELAIETAREWTDRPLVMIAGAVGKTAQAVEEARTARSLGYHAVLLSLAALKGASEDELIEHCTAVAKEMPLVGFYLQTAVGGIPLSRAFWARFAAIDNVVAIKVAPFNRYRTLDVAVGIAQAHAEDRITLYTGNDDHIVADLVTPMVVRTGNREVTLRFQGGLLGHWSVWTRGAVEMLERLKLSVSAGAIPPQVLALDSFVTDCNSVVFDVDHDFAGCIPGCHEILRRQGLMTSIECLDPHETLEPGPERRHRSPLRHLSRAERRRLRRGQPRALAELRWTTSLPATTRSRSGNSSRQARSAPASCSTARWQGFAP